MKQKRIFAVVLLLGCFVWPALSDGASLDEVQTQIKETARKLSETKRREKSALGSLIKAERQLEQLESSLANLNPKLATTEQQIAVLTAQLNRAQEELDRLKSEMGGQQELVNQRVRALYIHGFQSQLEMLFTVKDFAEFVTRFEMVGRFIRGDLRIIRGYQVQQNLILRKKNEILQKQSELNGQKSLFTRLQLQYHQEQSRQLLMRQNKAIELEALQNNRQQLEKALDELEETSKEVEAQIREYQDKNMAILGTGSYMWPVSGKILQYFGWRVHPILRKRKFHTGIDIPQPSGTPVLAADSGVVMFSGINGGYGKLVIIYHGAGFSTVYGHNSVLLVNKGQAVTKGEVVAKVGSTGLSTGPHVHFEVRKDGVPVDPLGYLKL
jgi:murein DD-endopeptidase MepM/ murein hydrolase activator NlpD